MNISTYCTASFLGKPLKFNECELYFSARHKGVTRSEVLLLASVILDASAKLPKARFASLVLEIAKARMVLSVELHVRASGRSIM